MIAASALAAAAIVAGLLSMPKTVTVEIINEGTTPDEATYEPQTASVQPGMTVFWKNTDASAHTVTSREPGFDSGVMGPDEEFQFTFESPGMFEYYCKIHPVMAGSVQVQLSRVPAVPV
jgi:plastocyanin